MCGRFAAGHLTFGQIREILEGFVESRVTVKDGAQAPTGGYHIRPTNQIAVVLKAGDGALVTSARWQVTAAGGRKMINARIENDRYWRRAFLEGRCLIPALGYFEWCRENGRKTPFFVSVKRNEPLVFFAGLMSEDRSGCVILTRPPSPQIAHIHNRMPVILSPGELPGWLDGTVSTEAAQTGLGTGWEGRFTWHEVAPLTRDAEGPETIAPRDSARDDGPPQASFDF